MTERFEGVSDQYDPDAVEERVREYWEETDAYERTREHRADGEPYYFLDGPPYTSGAAHMGHAWNKSLKDVYIRYKRMQGFDVYDRPGYDMHGLPIETKVEEEQSFANKKDIEAFGVDEFIEECRRFAERSLEQLQEDFRSFGVWMDWEDPYRTVEPEYMESAWWAFSRADDRGLVEKGKRSISQCPRCETAIANNEVEYHQVEDPSIYVTFPLVGREGSLVIWTTTPWTIPANTFVAVGGDVEYVGVDATRDGETERLYVAADVVEEVLEKGRYDDYEVVEELDGEAMVGWEYEHPLGDLVDHPGGEGAFQVYTADYVEVDRTGLVHSAPGHGEEDFERGRELGLEVFCPVGGDGVYDERAGPYAGTFVRDANEEIRTDLDERGYLLADETYVHDYGQCWRCDSDVIQIVTDQWFVTVTDVKGDLLENVEDSEWHPSWARDNRFRDFVENAPDWNVSRQRYWGIPIPIWTPEGADPETEDEEMIVIGTREELAERVDQDVDPDAVDLHKPTVDELTITEDGVTYTRVPDVFDVWLDSSVASWGTLGYPGAPGSEDAHEELWPADLIIEAHDQTRGWFWSQLGMGTAAVDRVPYERVVMHGHALMPDGRAMSKSRDITIAPGEVIEEHGADPMRLFLLSIAARGDDMRVSWEEISEMERRLNILWNVFRFPLPYMRMDGVDPADLSVEAVADAGELELVDEWLLSRLSTVVEAATGAFEEFAQHEAVDAVLEFVLEDVSRFYVQVVRERMWEEEDSPSKRAAYATLTHVVEETAKLLAPFAPFVADEIYTTLLGDGGHPTVHMADWPAPDERFHDPDLERGIDAVRTVEEAGANARQQAERKLRWPVPRVVVAPDDVETAEAVRGYSELLADRLNARRIEVVEPGSDWSELEYTARADMSLLGPAFGDRAREVMEALNDVPLEAPDFEALRAGVAERLDDVDPGEIDPEMIEFRAETPDEVASAEFDGDARGTVYVDTSLDEGIESEGYAREVVRRAQQMRKELDLDLDARVRLTVDVDDDRVADLIERHADLVAGEVRADTVAFEAVDADVDVDADSGSGALVREWDVEGVTMTLVVEPLAAPDPSED